MHVIVPLMQLGENVNPNIALESLGKETQMNAWWLAWNFFWQKQDLMEVMEGFNQGMDPLHFKQKLSAIFPAVGALDEKALEKLWKEMYDSDKILTLLANIEAIAKMPDVDEVHVIGNTNCWHQKFFEDKEVSAYLGHEKIKLYLSYKNLKTEKEIIEGILEDLKKQEIPQTEVILFYPNISFSTPTWYEWLFKPIETHFAWYAKKYWDSLFEVAGKKCNAVETTAVGDQVSTIIERKTDMSARSREKPPYTPGFFQTPLAESFSSYALTENKEEEKTKISSSIVDSTVPTLSPSRPN